MEAVVIALIALCLIEAILFFTWTRLYFTTGIPLFFRRLNAFSPSATVPTAKEVSERLPHSKYPPFVFHDLGGNRLAFREKVWTGFNCTPYTPLMRGLLVFDPLQAKVRVTGFANWAILVSSLVMLYVLLSTLLSSGAPVLVLLLLLLFLVGLLASIYRIQARRFTEAATAAVNAWSTVDHRG